jgi:exosome complex component RRP46
MIRRDLRNAKQTRDVSIVLGGVEQAEGAVKLSFGETSVSVSVAGPAQPKYSRHEESDRCHLEIEVLPSSAHDPTHLQTDDNFMKTEFVRRVLSSCIPLEDFPRMCITVQILVLQDEGSLLSTILNASMLALLDAGIPLRHFVSSVQVVKDKKGDELLLDPTLAEERASSLKCIASFVADATLDFHGSDDKLVAYEVQGSVQRKEFDALLSEARVFAQALSHTLREAIANKYR